MSVSARSFKRAAIGMAAALGGAFAMAGSAEAIEKGCHPIDQVRAQAAAEGQKVLIKGQRITGAGDKDPMNSFTSNSDGSKGYQIEADDAQGLACVRAIYRNVVLYNNEPIAVLPKQALYSETSRAQALEICKNRGGCGYHDDFMRDTYLKKEPLVLSADLVVGDATTMKIFVNAAATGERLGQVSVTNTAVGVNEFRGALSNVGYTQDGANFLRDQGKNRQVASNQPN